MTNLTIAATLWIVSHLGIINSPVRPALVKMIGKPAYTAAYSLLSLAVLVFLIISFNRVEANSLLWMPLPLFKWLAIALMPFVCILLVGTFMTTNPTIVGQGHTLKTFDKGAGVIRITRHPFQWSVIIWATVHILANGDLASLIFFGALALVSAVGTLTMDKKKAVKLGDDWQKFAAVTSNLPFAAILQGRNEFRASELLKPALIGLIVYVLFLFKHEWVSGISLF